MKKLLLLTIFLIINFSTIFCEPIKVVFTGGPSTGKTTLINALAKRGFYVVEETATALINEEQKKGNMQPWQNLEQFQLNIANKQISTLNPAFDLAQTFNAEFIFLDRAFPDGLAYFKLNSMTPPTKIVELANSGKYDFVFVLDFLNAYESSQVRREGMEEALKIHNLLIGVYEFLGYSVIHVPAAPVDERIDFVLNKLRQAKTHSL